MEESKDLETVKEIVFAEDELEDIVTSLYEDVKDCPRIFFSGPLGAGKTTLIRALLRRYGVKEQVTSPTFAYVNRYVSAEGKNLYHFDLYRLQSAADFYNEGFAEYLDDPHGRSFVEWPEIIISSTSSEYCLLELDYSGDGRKLVLKKNKKV